MPLENTVMSPTVTVTPLPFALTKADALPKIREAFLANRLSAQHPGDVRAAYRNENNRPCAIGVLIPDDLAKRIDDNEFGFYGVASLSASTGVFKITNGNELIWFASVQTAHDQGDITDLKKLLDLP